MIINQNNQNVNKFANIQVKLQELFFNKYLNKFYELIKVNKYTDENEITCFFSYAWGDDAQKEQIINLKNSLCAAGIRVYFDEVDNPPGTYISEFIERIKTSNYIIIFISSNLITKLNDDKGESVIKKEMNLIETYYSKSNKKVFKITLEPGLHAEPKFVEELVSITYTANIDSLINATFNLLYLMFASLKMEHQARLVINDFNQLIYNIMHECSCKQIDSYLLTAPASAFTKTSIEVAHELKRNYCKIFSNLNVFEKKIIQEPLNIEWSFHSPNSPSKKYESFNFLELRDKIIFDFLKKKHPIIVQGDPGSGKSTLCTHIAHQWASNLILSDFKFVFFVKINNLKEASYPDLPLNEYEEVDIIIKECYTDTPIDLVFRVLLKMNLDYNQNKILWIIEENENLINNIPKQLKHVIAAIKLYPHVIIATHKQQNEYSYYKLNGFATFSREIYVKSFFYQQENPKFSNYGTKLLHFLNDYDFIRALASIPIYLKHICNIWLKNEKDLYGIFHLSITKLYEELSWFIVNKSFPEYTCDKYAKNFSLRLLFLAIREMAYILYIRNITKLQISEGNAVILQLTLAHDVQEILPDIFNQILKTGIILQKDNCLQFIDDSLQVFFAAEHLIINSKEKNYCLNKDLFVKIIEDNKYTQKCKLLYIFISGLLYKNPDILAQETNDLFWQTILNNYDLLGANDVCLVLKCLIETNHKAICKTYPNIASYIIKSLEYILKYAHRKHFVAVKKVLLDLADNYNVVDIIMNISEGSGFLYDFLNFIIVQHSNFEEVILNWIFGLDRESIRKISNLIRQVTMKHNMRNLISYSGLIDVLKFTKLEIKIVALNRISNEKILHPEIIDAICWIIINSVEMNEELDAGIMEVINKIANDVPYTLQAQYSIVRDLKYLSLDVLCSIVNPKYKLLEILKIVSFNVKDSNLKKSIGIFMNNLNVDSESIFNDSEHCEDDYFFTFVDDDHLTSYVEKYSSYYEISFDDERWDAIIADPRKLNELQDGDVYKTYQNLDYFVQIDLPGLVSVFSISHRKVFADWIIKRLMFKCDTEVLQIIETGIIIFHCNNNTPFAKKNESWKHDQILKMALVVFFENKDSSSFFADINFSLFEAEPFIPVPFIPMFSSIPESCDIHSDEPVVLEPNVLKPELFLISKYFFAAVPLESIIYCEQPKDFLNEFCTSEPPETDDFEDDQINMIVTYYFGQQLLLPQFSCNGISSILATDNKKKLKKFPRKHN